jgi:hypothetical protein
VSAGQRVGFDHIFEFSEFDGRSFVYVLVTVLSLRPPLLLLVQPLQASIIICVILVSIMFFRGASGFLSSLLLAALQSGGGTAADWQFHDWFSSVGVTTPLTRLETTPRNVAGRGVFAANDIQECDVAITIPEDVALHEYNAAANFPDLAQARTMDEEIKFREERKKRPTMVTPAFETSKTKHF